MQPWQIALEYQGVPFVHLGRTDKGLDCVGLLMLVATRRGLAVVDNPYYGREPSRHNNAFDLADYLRLNCGDPVDRGPAPNDILLIRFKPHHQPSHLGIVAPHPHGLGIVHTHEAESRVVFQRIDEPRMKQIAGIYAWPEKL